MSTNGALQDLDDGLILRRTTCEDTEGLIAEELETLEADCGALNDHGRALVRFLFPGRASNVWEVS